MPTSLPVADSLLALAPLRLVNHRRLRYVGDDACVRLDHLSEPDQAAMRNLYAQLTEFLNLLADTATSDEQKWDDIQAWIDRYDLNNLVHCVRALGVESMERRPSEELAKAMHDVRGGALSPLLGRLQLFGYVRTMPEGLNILFVQARDHLKIMRNAVVGLDEARRTADRRPRAHAMQLMLDKWQGSIVGPQWRERPVRLDIDCRYEGPVTECCLESAAIDRIFYNLASNACRHAADRRLEMAIFPIPQPPGDCLRFVLSNEVLDDDAERLKDALQTDADSVHLGKGHSLFALFEPKDPTVESGLGLAVVADFVAGAFGLRDRHEALHERYVGAVLDGRTFRAWFHWPMANPDLPQKLDDYRRPRESLSEP